MVCGGGTAPGWLGQLRRGMGMILVTGKSVVVSGGLRGWVYIHPAPFDSTCPYPPAPKSLGRLRVPCRPMSTTRYHIALR